MIFKNLLKDLPFLFFFSNFLKNRTVVSLSYFANLGSLALVFFLSQIVSGLVLSTWYIPTIDLAFESISFLMSDTFGGSFFRFLHVLGASFFFFIVYLHVFKNIFYCSFAFPKHFLWWSGCIILIFLMIIAFFGYILPWGNMSYWASVVVTNVIAVLGKLGYFLSIWLLGDFVITQHTLSKFFTFHYFFPFFLFFVVVIHFYLLHLVGSSQAIGLSNSSDYILFDPYYKVKDIYGFIIFFFFCCFFVVYLPYLVMHAENFENADRVHTPLHIVPEWYFLLFYGILRSVPSKLFGIFLVVLIFLLLFFLPIFYGHFLYYSNFKFSFFCEILFFFFLISIFSITFLGGKPIFEIFMLYLFFFVNLLIFIVFLFSTIYSGFIYLLKNTIFASSNTLHKLAEKF